MAYLTHSSEQVSVAVTFSTHSVRISYRAPSLRVRCFRQWLGQHLNEATAASLQISFQFLIHKSAFNPTLYSLYTNSVVNNRQTN
jgi:hypothetical protein